MERPSPAILLVEPDPFERLQLTRILRDSGYRVTVAGEPGDALDLFVSRRHHIAMVLWRARMLGVAGLELRDAIHAVAPDFPVLAIDDQTSGAAGHCLDGSSTHGEILSEVARHLPMSASAVPRSAQPPCFGSDDREAWSGGAPISSTRFTVAKDGFSWPMPDEEFARIETEDRYPRRSARHEESMAASGLAEAPDSSRTAHFLATSATGPDRFQPIATQDVRDYIFAERQAHLMQLRRLARIGITIGATCAIIAIVYFG